MTSELIQGVDSSYDQLTVQQAVCLYRKGKEIFVQALTALPRSGLHQPIHRISNLRNALQGGMAIAGYLLIGPGMTGFQAVAAARQGIPMDVWKKLDFVAVDVEVDGVSAQEVLKALEEVERLDMKAVVYSSYNSWMTMVRPRNSYLISGKGFELWNASWDGDPAISFLRHPYGGWLLSQVIGDQWAGGHEECDQSVDSNTFRRDIIAPPVEPDTFEATRFSRHSTLRLVFTNALPLGAAWWLTTAPFSWRMHVTNLAYMDYMQQNQDWPIKVDVLTGNDAKIFRGIPHLASVPALIR